MNLFVEPPNLDCPRCSSPIPSEIQACGACGCALTGVRLYDPKDFVWLALLFSALFPIFMAGSNWGRVGRIRRKWLYWASGLTGFVTLCSGLYLINGGAGRETLVFNCLFNLPLGFILRNQQRDLYSTALRLGAAPATRANGWLGGLAFLLCAIAVFAGAAMAMYQIEFHAGLAMMHEQRYEPAAAKFKRILELDPDADAALFNLALCHVLMEHWDEGAGGFEKYLKRDRKNAAALAFLAYVRYRQGRYSEANALRSKARALDPEIMEKLFGPDHVFSGPPQPARAGPSTTGLARSWLLAFLGAWPSSSSLGIRAPA